MFDIGWSEMAVILMVALIVIGPKDLPRVARTVGKWTAKARGMAREFQRSLDDMAREAELQDIKAEMEKLSRTDMRHKIEETIDPEGELRRSLNAPVGEEKRADQAAQALPSPVVPAAVTPPPAQLPETTKAPAESAPSAPPGEKR
jgi:sec-independent protein translocase protein TatB